ncbi:hypothetical protein GA0074692_6539 [Micromonospora pallida]|uniref:Uncharacterized protein n=1 Tax=Micromonospora pallida TaxID=145854 RepID=A0A1C6TJE8_9ACTN|nr:hypothetical protein GA0074692_6539 [Micromonospora pallida]
MLLRPRPPAMMQQGRLSAAQGRRVRSDGDTGTAPAASGTDCRTCTGSYPLTGECSDVEQPGDPGNGQRQQEISRARKYAGPDRAGRDGSGFGTDIVAAARLFTPTGRGGSRTRTTVGCGAEPSADSRTPEHDAGHRRHAPAPGGAATGLSPTTVSAVRRRLSLPEERESSRVGRDGRVRPLDGSAGRLRASEVIARAPRPCAPSPGRPASRWGRRATYGLGYERARTRCWPRSAGRPFMIRTAVRVRSRPASSRSASHPSVARQIRSVAERASPGRASTGPRCGPT